MRTKTLPSTLPASRAGRRRASASTVPCLGTREFPADFALVPDGAALPSSELPGDQRDRDLGWMLHDIDFHPNGTARQSNFFRARLSDGILDVRACLRDGGMAA